MSINIDANNPNYLSSNGLLLSKDGKTLIQGINGNVTIPGSVTSVGEHAFSGCSGLTSVTIGNSVTSIGWYAFSGCSGLMSITIPDSVTSIGHQTFYGCSALTSITIPDSVTRIDVAAFEGCPNELFNTTSISGVKLVDGWVVGHSSSLSGTLDLTGVRGIASSAFFGCSGLTSITIPDSVTSIAEWAFYGCSGLMSITIPDSVTSIGHQTFYGCSALTSITIPDSVTSIGSSAFENCSGLTSITIPESLAGKTGSWRLPSGCQVIVYDNSCVGIDGVLVPKTWISGNAADALAAADGNYWTAARAKAANGRPVWECYVADLDPEDPDDDLVAGIELVDGRPKVRIERGERAERAYTVQGAKTLGGGWTDLEDGVDWDAAGYRFFRVKVEVP